MTLEEAKEMVSDEIANICDEELSEAWYTVLKALDESIPKEKIKEIIYPTPENEVPIEVQASDMYSRLKELLGE